MRDSSGGPEYFIGAIEDIIVRKRIEEAQHFLAEASDVLSSSLDYRESSLAWHALRCPLLPTGASWTSSRRRGRWSGWRWSIRIQKRSS